MLKGDWRINKSHSLTPEGRKAQHERVKAEIFAALGDKCCKCGFDDPRALQVDHVEGGGNEERKTKRGTSYFYHIKKNLDSGRYQLLCANCNWIKRHENKEHR